VHVTVLLLLSLAVFTESVNAQCAGTPIQNPMKFWSPGGQPNQEISHVTVPLKVNGFTVDAGYLGINRFANQSFMWNLDTLGKPDAFGTVDTTYGLPDFPTGGYPITWTEMHDNFNQGLNPDNFVLLEQKGGIPGNLAVVLDEVDGIQKNVLRFQALSKQDPSNPSRKIVASSANIQTANLYASGHFSVKAKFPPAQGLVYAFWTFHWEPHLSSDHLPPGKSDPQYVPDLTGWQSQTNHEIDIEIPASCPSMCPGGGCPGQFDTMNINNYIFTNNDGGGPGYANLCVRAPNGTQFIDSKYHTYTIEWHTGDSTCPPKVNFFFDGKVSNFISCKRLNHLLFLVVYWDC